MIKKKKKRRKTFSKIPANYFGDVRCDNMYPFISGLKLQPKRTKTQKVRNVLSIMKINLLSGQSAFYLSHVIPFFQNNQIIHGSDRSIPPPPTLIATWLSQAASFPIKHTHCSLLSVTQTLQFKAQRGCAVLSAEDEAQC